MIVNVYVSSSSAVQLLLLSTLYTTFSVLSAHGIVHSTTSGSATYPDIAGDATEYASHDNTLPVYFGAASLPSAFT